MKLYTVTITRSVNLIESVTVEIEADNEVGAIAEARDQFEEGSIDDFIAEERETLDPKYDAVETARAETPADSETA
jgi:hypothetical protein